MTWLYLNERGFVNKLRDRDLWFICYLQLMLFNFCHDVLFTINGYELIDFFG